jgi:hypothetical protein
MLDAFPLVEEWSCGSCGLSRCRSHGGRECSPLEVGGCGGEPLVAELGNQVVLRLLVLDARQGVAMTRLHTSKTASLASLVLTKAAPSRLADELTGAFFPVDFLEAGDILPWSVEPMPGWPGTEHPHTGEVTGGREDSPGWTAEQKQTVKQLRMECTDLSIWVTAHSYWATLEGEQRVKARSELKAVTRPSAMPRSMSPPTSLAAVTAGAAELSA